MGNLLNRPPLNGPRRLINQDNSSNIATNSSALSREELAQSNNNTQQALSSDDINNIPLLQPSSNNTSPSSTPSSSLISSNALPSISNVPSHAYGLRRRTLERRNTSTVNLRRGTHNQQPLPSIPLRSTPLPPQSILGRRQRPEEEHNNGAPLMRMSFYYRYPGSIAGVGDSLVVADVRFPRFMLSRQRRRQIEQQISRQIPAANNEPGSSSTSVAINNPSISTPARSESSTLNSSEDDEIFVPWSARDDPSVQFSIYCLLTQEQRANANTLDPQDLLNLTLSHFNSIIRTENEPTPGSEGHSTINDSNETGVHIIELTSISNATTSSTRIPPSASHATFRDVSIAALATAAARLLLSSTADTYEELIRLQEMLGHVSRGLKEDQFLLLPKPRPLQPSDPDCPICLERNERIEEREFGEKIIKKARIEQTDDNGKQQRENLSNNEQTMVRQLSCKHTFHATCIDRWLTDVNSCPMCRLPALRLEENFSQQQAINQSTSRT